MKMLVQRVKHAKVTVDGNVTGAIEQGYLVLLGIFNIVDFFVFRHRMMHP